MSLNFGLGIGAVLAAAAVVGVVGVSKTSTLANALSKSRLMSARTCCALV